MPMTFGGIFNQQRIRIAALISTTTITVYIKPTLWCAIEKDPGEIT